MAASATSLSLPEGVQLYKAVAEDSCEGQPLKHFPDAANPDFEAAKELSSVLAEISATTPVKDVVNPAQSIGHTFIWADEVDSTQLLPRRIWGSSPPHGTVISARRQTQGRGRSSNQWSSPEGCLMFTTVLRAPLQWGQHMPLLQHAMAVAAAEGVNNALRQCGAPPSTTASIKWPNDIYLSRGAQGPSTAIDDDAPAKIGGILCQSEFDSASSSFVLCVGMGLNVYDTPPFRSIRGYLSGGAGAAEAEASTPIPKAQLLACLLESIQTVWVEFERGRPEEKGSCPFQPLLARYTNLWLHSGQIVTAHDPVAAKAQDDGDVSTSMRQGTQVRIFALCPRTGALLASEDTTASQGAGVGTVWELHPDGNSLDMMQGLLKHKVTTT